MRILVTNDDGIDSPGIMALATALKEIGDVVVVAPDRQQSAVGHALTVSSPLRAVQFHRDNQLFGWAVDGTPADCVKLAFSSLLTDAVDLVVSGINHGYNTAINVLYSGTVSAATEGMLLGVPSIAVSLGTFSWEADMTVAAQTAQYVASRYFELGIPKNTLLNVNIPALPAEDIKGIKITQQGHGEWIDKYEERFDPMGKPYYWIRGEYRNLDGDNRSDDVAVEQGYIAITPITFKLTDYDTMNKLREIF
ncbi:MAG: 5'/3'-nucleotidase SurE [Candidatus Kapabacteria bacterium]|nr:5'/3'-nucleotidase SurE [Candidatus Kapabacteria bacterium]